MIRFVKIAVALISLLLVATIAIPNLLSTAYVKERVARQLSEITGAPVSLNGGSSISLSPYLSVSYDRVSIGAKTLNSKPVIVMDSLKAKLGILSAIWGDAQLAELEMIRPRFNLRINENGENNWLFKKGPLAKRLTLEAGKQPAPLALGKITIIDGIAKINNAQQRTTHEITSVNGTITWADITSAGAIDVTGVWLGENLKLSATVGSPFEILRGGSSAIEAKLMSKPLTLNYSGSINTTEMSGKGSVTASSPSVRRLTEWLGFPISATQILGAAMIKGDVHASLGALEFPEAAVSIGKHIGSGRLQLSRDDKFNPVITGTLAFETINLPSFSQLPSPQNGVDKAENKLDFSFLKGFSLDLRLSANTAVSAPFELANFAAAVIIRDENANFDIGQADALGGMLSGSINLKTENDQGQFSMNMALANIDLGKLTKLYGDNSITLNGKGNARIKLKSSGASTDLFVARLNGEGSIQGRNGSIGGIDLPGLFSAAKESEQAVWRLIDGTTDYSNLKIGFFIANGIAFMRGTEMTGDEIIVSLGGQSDLTQRSLALRGKIFGKTDDDKADEENSMSFFVGGTTGAPLIIPLPN